MVRGSSEIRIATIQSRQRAPWQNVLGSIGLCEGATMRKTGSKSDRRLMRLQDQVPVWR
jgi:hypothetical protein